MDNRTPARWTRIGVVMLVLMNALLLIDRWAGPSSLLPAAMAQVADSGAQLQALIEQTKKSNELLARIAARLEKGPVPVRDVTKDAGKTGREGP